jgi:hypothetical protein
MHISAKFSGNAYVLPRIRIDEYFIDLYNLEEKVIISVLFISPTRILQKMIIFSIASHVQVKRE